MLLNPKKFIGFRQKRHANMLFGNEKVTSEKVHAKVLLKK